MPLFKLEEHLKSAVSVSEVAGVYWSARDLKFPNSILESFIPNTLLNEEIVQDNLDITITINYVNHHFVTIIFENVVQAEEICGNWGKNHEVLTNDNEVEFPYVTYGIGSSNGGLTGDMNINFTNDQDQEALNEIAKEADMTSDDAIWDIECHRVPFENSNENFNSLHDFCNEVLKKGTRFEDNYNLEKRIKYNLLANNCATFVNTLFKELGITDNDRNSLRDFSGIDQAENKLIPGWLFYTLDDYVSGYIGNMRTRELHELDCYWITRMAERNKIYFQTVAQALSQGYNGCASCLKSYDTG